jgi:hypothetical protein
MDFLVNWKDLNDDFLHERTNKRVICGKKERYNAIFRQSAAKAA